jgi:pimeloyl-ACP methyl ester carboxylesterase
VKWPHGLAAAAVVVLAVVALSTEPAPRHVEPVRAARRVDAGEVTLRVVRGGRGTAVVMLHGYGESLMSWRGVFDRVAAVADAIALDLPGFGLSDKPATGYHNDRMAAAVLGVMDSLGVPDAVLVGHSMGGAVALRVALRAPQRVRGLVLLAPAVSASGWNLPIPSDSARTSDWLRRAVAGYETMRPRFTGPHDPSWLAETDSALAYTPAADPAYGAALRAVLREFDFDYLTPTQAARLRMPTLLIWGEFDHTVPLAVGRALAATMPSARLEVLRRRLHRPHVEHPVDVANLIVAFLRSPLAPGGTTP